MRASSEICKYDLQVIVQETEAQRSETPAKRTQLAITRWWGRSSGVQLLPQLCAYKTATYSSPQQHIISIILLLLFFFLSLKKAVLRRFECHHDKNLFKHCWMFDKSTKRRKFRLKAENPDWHSSLTKTATNLLAFVLERQTSYFSKCCFL